MPSLLVSLFCRTLLVNAGIAGARASRVARILLTVVEPSGSIGDSVGCAIAPAACCAAHVRSRTQHAEAVIIIFFGPAVPGPLSGFTRPYMPFDVIPSQAGLLSPLLYFLCLLFLRSYACGCVQYVCACVHTTYLVIVFLRYVSEVCVCGFSYPYRWTFPFFWPWCLPPPSLPLPSPLLPLYPLALLTREISRGKVARK